MERAEERVQSEGPSRGHFAAHTLPVMFRTVWLSCVGYVVLPCERRFFRRRAPCGKHGSRGVGIQLYPLPTTPLPM